MATYTSIRRSEDFDSRLSRLKQLLVERCIDLSHVLWLTELKVISIRINQI